jgi:serine/threonine-protein kinase RsbT
MKHKTKQIAISDEIDIAKAASNARILAEEAGFKQTEQFMVATAVSELARNIYTYAMKGEITIKIIERKAKRGIEIVAEDYGPGIKDIAQAMKGQFSTSGSLGLGLSGAKRLMDEFIVDTERKRGTKIIVRKWV